MNQTTIGSFPNTPTSRAKIKYKVVHWISRHRNNPTTAKWANKTPFERIQ
jgi:hypothetical protein